MTVEEGKIMAFAIHSPQHGTFIGEGLGLLFFSKTETAGQVIAATAPDLIEANEIIDIIKGADPEFSDLEAVEVESGHWTHLKAAGLDIGTMDQNAAKYADA